MHTLYVKLYIHFTFLDLLSMSKRVAMRNGFTADRVAICINPLQGGIIYEPYLYMPYL